MAVADVGILVSTSSSPSTALAGTTPGNVSTVTSTTRLLQQQQCSTTFVDCVKGNVRGTTITCKAACQGTCCVGGLTHWQPVYFEACDFFTGQVCKDGKSCTGASACSGAYIPTVVNHSCTGEDACRGGAVGNIVDSCIGEEACEDAGIDGAVGNITNSCIGRIACSEAGSDGGSAGNIVDSCIGEEACYDAGNREQSECL